MEFASSILDVATRLYDCITNTTYHIRHFEGNMDSLRNKMEILKRKRNDVKTEVEAGERQLPGRRRTEHVDAWLQEVEELEREVNDVLRQGEEEIRKGCFKICPPKCWSTYKLGEKVQHKLRNVADMSNTADNFRDVTLPLAPAHAQEIPLGTTVGLDSNFQKLLSLFADDGVGIIGIYGMGGVGKTTLLKKLNNELAINQSLGGFDKVIWVTVSQDLSTTESVQDKIGKTLGFSDDIWKDKSKDQKQAAILHHLKMKNFVLLLDDIWKWIDLLEVGVPILADNQNKAKVVFTARSEQVCFQMKAKEKIKVECLAWQQAWDLFKEKVGEEIVNSDPEIKQVAQDVCKECAGLPLALITIGRAMASRTTLQQWNYAIRELKKSTFKISGMEDHELFRRLQFSYDSLSDETIKICFLYCALYPEDWNIYVPDLIELWIGEGFLDDECDNIDDACKLAYEIIDRLKLACLLLESKESHNNNRVNMHDVIRDMALWIVSEIKKEKYLVQERNISKWEKAERVFLLGNLIDELSGTPKCPNLLTLCLENIQLRTISDSFFQLMPTLKVLDLSYNWSLRELPSSFFGLLSLQHLNLSNTVITQFSIEFKSLVKLKYLYLNHMTELRIIPPQIISSLFMLQRLEMSYSGDSEGIDEGSILFGGNELLLDELECLNHLQYLRLSVKSELALQKLLSSQKLQSCTFGLLIQRCKGLSQLQLSSLQQNMKRLEFLWIRKCDDLEELSMDGMRCEERERAAVPHKNKNNPWAIKSRIDGSKSFHNLRRVSIQHCKVLKDLTWLISVPNLQSLDIGRCDAMEEVIKDAEDCCSSSDDIVREGSLSVFGRLQTLNLWTLPELKSIYSHPLPFPSLIHVTVNRCPKLKKLPFDSNSGKDTLRSIECEREWWNKLEWENEETLSAFSPLFAES